MDRDPVVQLELVLRLELVVLAVVPEEQQEHDRRDQPGGDEDTHLAQEGQSLKPVDEPGSHDQPLSRDSISRRRTREPRCTVKRITASTAAESPASLPAVRPTISTPRATIQARARPVAPSQPIAALRSRRATAPSIARFEISSTP